MPAYWCEFAQPVQVDDPAGNRAGRVSAGCIEVKDADAAWAEAAGLAGQDPVNVRILPYPAEPRLVKHIDPSYGACPSFCYQPRRCAGHTSCPQPYACSE